MRSTVTLVEVWGNTTPLGKFCFFCILLSPWGVSCTLCAEMQSHSQRQREKIRNRKQEVRTHSWKGEEDGS